MQFKGDNTAGLILYLAAFRNWSQGVLLVAFTFEVVVIIISNTFSHEQMDSV